MPSHSAPPIPQQIFDLMAEIGPKWGSNVPGHVQQMIDAYTALLATCPKEGVEVRKDLAYGTHPRHVLDVYRPAGAKNAPIVVFQHGGAFTDGDKDRSSEIYGNVCLYLARHGVVAISIKYRLAPEFTFPAATADLASACRWAVDNAEAIGGDARRLFPFGHSAGATHAAHYAYEAAPAGAGPMPAGVIIVSGRVRIDNRSDNPNARKVEAYFGTDSATFDARSAVNMVKRDSVPTFIAFAQYENPLLDMYSLELAHRIAVTQGRQPRVMQLWGHNHTSIVAHWNTAEDRLGRAVLDFIAAP
jgi:acetyl esterase/lipase